MEKIRELQAKNIEMAEDLNKLTRERDELARFRGEVFDMAFLQMTHPQDFGHKCIGDLKDISERVLALEKAQIDKTATKKERVLLCKLYNIVSRIIPLNNVGEIWSDLEKTYDECTTYFRS